MCDERLHKIHSNKLNLVHSLHTPQTTTSQRQNTRIELTTKAKRADFLKLKKFLWEKFSEKKRMTLICGLAIILPIYAIQNQELPEVEMFCRHTIGGYQFDFYHRSRMRHLLLSKIFSIQKFSMLKKFQPVTLFMVVYHW